MDRDRWKRDLVDVSRSGLPTELGVTSQHSRLVGRRRGDLIFIESGDVWAFEAADRLTFVHCTDGRFDLDISLRELEGGLGRDLFRPHRNWLVYPGHVREWRRCSDRSVLVVGKRTETGGPVLEVPVSANRLPAVREALLAGAVGLRRRTPSSVTTGRANSAVSMVEAEEGPELLESSGAGLPYRLHG